MASFHTIIETAKSNIESCETNTQLRAYLTSIADSTTRFANKLKERRFGGFDFVNPISWFREFYAPSAKQVLVEWQQVDESILALRAYILSVPKDSETPSDVEGAKGAVVSCLSNAQTVMDFQTDTSGQLAVALTTLGGDIANAPKVLAQAIKSSAEIVATRIIAPLSEGVSIGVWTLAKSILTGFWWVLLIAVVVIVGMIALARSGGIAGLTGRLVNG